jgi:hypothetical protein
MTEEQTQAASTNDTHKDQCVTPMKRQFPHSVAAPKMAA